jgi:hypothetical protein
MKPWFKSKRLWSAVIGSVASILTALITIYSGLPAEMSAVLVGSVASLATALVVAFGLGANGKEAAAVTAAAPVPGER